MSRVKVCGKSGWKSASSTLKEAISDGYFMKWLELNWKRGLGVILLTLHALFSVEDNNIVNVIIYNTIFQLTCKNSLNLDEEITVELFWIQWSPKYRARLIIEMLIYRLNWNLPRVVFFKIFSAAKRKYCVPFVE